MASKKKNNVQTLAVATNNNGMSWIAWFFYLIGICIGWSWKHTKKVPSATKGAGASIKDKTLNVYREAKNGFKDGYYTEIDE